MPDAEIISEIGKLFGGGVAGVALIAYLFRALPPASRDRENKAYDMLKTMNDKMDRMSDEMHTKFGETNGRIDETKKEVSGQNVRLVTVETTQRFMLERIGSAKGE